MRDRRVQQAVAGVWKDCRYGPSRAEEDLLAKLRAYAPHIHWFGQVKMTTPFADFWVDMAGLVKPGRAIGIEVDGEQFHQDKVRDFCRDCLILGTGRLAAIYRIPVHDLKHWPWIVLHTIGIKEDGLFPQNLTGTLRDLSGSLWDCPKLRLVYTKRDGKGVQEFLSFAQENQGLGWFALVEAYRRMEET